MALLRACGDCTAPVYLCFLYELVQSDLIDNCATCIVVFLDASIGSLRLERLETGRLWNFYEHVDSLATATRDLAIKCFTRHTALADDSAGLATYVCSVMPSH